MDLTASEQPQFDIDTADRVYVGLNAEIIDHPGNPSRIELGRRPQEDDTRKIGDGEFTYVNGPDRDFAIFVPGLRGSATTYDAASIVRHSDPGYYHGTWQPGA